MMIDDLVYLTRKEFFDAGLLEGALQNNDIAYRKVYVGDVSGSLSYGGEKYNFYVIERDLDRSKDILTVLFGETEEIE